MTDTPKEGGWYRCCVYASKGKRRGVHQFALLVTASGVHPAYAPTAPPYVLVAGKTEPVPVDMVASWGERVEPMGRRGPKLGPQDDPKAYLVQQESEAGGPMITWSAWLTRTEAEYALRCGDNGRPSRVFVVDALGPLGKLINPAWDEHGDMEP